MQNDIYRRQVAAHNSPIDMDFWRNPEGVDVPDDELRFLLVPDAVEAAAVGDVAQQVHRYQAEHQGTRDEISRALIVTMGGMLPGALLCDHLVGGRGPSRQKIEFGTIGVSLYKEPGIRYEQPLFQHRVSIPIRDETVLMVDDLGDTGGTMAFLSAYLADSGVHKSLNLALYMKPSALAACCVDFYFGETAQDTWIITPRERVETLVKRVPVWRQRGASQDECRRRLIEIIGYPAPLVDQYLGSAYQY